MVANKVIENVSFGNFSFRDYRWDECKFVGCVFGKTDINPIYRNCGARTKIVFENCTFLGQCAFMEGLLTDCKFIGCKFDNCKLYTSFCCCEFTDCTFDHADLFNNRFEICKFTRCETEFSDFRGVKCVKCVGKKFVRILSPLACPEKGEYEAWKQCLDILTGKKVYAKLLIPADAQRSSAHSNKCRASKAKVLGFYNEDGKRIKLKKARSWWDESFIYTVGKTVEPTLPYIKDRYTECASGIHHFMTLDDAVAWN